MTDPRNGSGITATARADPADDGVRGGRRGLLVAAMFGAVAVLVASDLVTDYRSGVRLAHLLIELTIFAFAAAGAAIMLREWARARRLARDLQVDVATARIDAERWRRRAEDHLAGLSALIDEQFDSWGLSAAERGVALLLLKGLSHKEVAAVRGTSERTVRQQSLTIYRKAGLGGRAELSAFFLEDLLAPPRSPPPA
jgi:DNA-binding CsgD family transcriptional regulator